MRKCSDLEDSHIFSFVQDGSLLDDTRETATVLQVLTAKGSWIKRHTGEGSCSGQEHILLG